jgi:hypothetical protein
MPHKTSCKTGCNGNLDQQMLSILIGCAETPIDPATLLSMVKVYGYCAVAAYYNPDTSDTNDPNRGKVTESGLALALDQCHKDILCLALKCKDSAGNTIFADIDAINQAANAGIDTNDQGWEKVPEGALDMTGSAGDSSNPFPSPALLAQLKKYKIDACCLCYDDIFTLAGGSFDDGESDFIINIGAQQAEITAALEVAQNMWALCDKTNSCPVMETYFGKEGLWFLYPCPRGSHRGSHKGKYQKKECLDECPKLTPADVIDTLAYSEIDGVFNQDEPAFYNTMVGYPWTVRGSCSFDSNDQDQVYEQQRWRQVAFMFCHVTVDEFCCAIEKERTLYLNNVGGVDYPGDMPVSEWANEHFDELPSEVLACADKITLLQKYDPTYEITLADIQRVCPGLNMCELIKLVSSLEVLSEEGCQPLVALDECVKVITYKDVVQSGDYAPVWADDDVVASANDLICVANAINLAGYFIESQSCVKDTNTGCVAEVAAETLLQLTFIDGVFASEGYHRHGKKDEKYQSPKCRKFSCECYESQEKFLCALAGLYVYNSASYVVTSKILSWVGCNNDDDWYNDLIDVSTIIVDSQDAFNVFKGYDVHARNEPLALINKVAPSKRGLVATIATVITVDGSSTTGTKADDNLAFFLALAKEYGFGKTLEAYDLVYKTGSGDGVGNSYNLTTQGGQRVQPANYAEAAGDCDTCYTDFSDIIVSILKCGPADYRKELLGKYKAITKEQLSLLTVDDDIDDLAAAMFAVIKSKLCAENIIEVFTIECDSLCDNQTRVYNIVKDAFANTDGNSHNTEQTYILRQVSQTYPLKSIIEYIGIYVLASNLGDDNFAQTVINRFPLCDVVGCHSCEGDSTEIEVSFEDVVFVIDSYTLDEYGCLTECKSLPWALSEYEECFGSSSDNCSTGSHGSGHHGKNNVRRDIQDFLSGKH